MKPIHYILLSLIAIIAILLMDDSDALTTCEKTQSDATCLHELK